MKNKKDKDNDFGYLILGIALFIFCVGLVFGVYLCSVYKELSCPSEIRLDGICDSGCKAMGYALGDFDYSSQNCFCNQLPYYN